MQSNTNILCKEMLSPTGKTAFHLALTLKSLNMVVHSQMKKLRMQKAFFRLVLLLVTPIGFHFAGHGFVLTNFLEETKCPSLSLLTTVAANPLHLSTLVIVLGILNAHQLQKIRWMVQRSLNKLKGIGIGLFSSILQHSANTC